MRDATERLSPWEKCAAAGMTRAEACRHLGYTKGAGYNYAKKHGIVFRPANMGRGGSMFARLSATERADYDTVKRAGHSRDYALVSIGRADLVTA